MQALEIKLAKGIDIERACQQLSLNVEAVTKWIDSKKEYQQFEDFADGLWGRKSAEEAIESLKSIIKETPDLEVKRRASKDLLEFYRDERKRLEQKVAEAKKIASVTIRADLFDLADNPWDFPSEG